MKLRSRHRSTPAESGWGSAFLLAFFWGIVPALPALLKGELLGSPWTDLYPSVWGLDWFAAQQPGFPLHTLSLHAPDGMDFYYSSPLHGWIATPFWALFGPVIAYNLTLLMARVATVLAAFGAFRALGLGPRGALAATGIYGASPFFHGYSVEGIIEGSDGWTLALWAWAVAARRPLLGAAAFFLTILSSWYLGMVACLLALGWGIRERQAWISAGAGLLLASPCIWSFAHAMPGATPLDSQVRADMGTMLHLPLPGLWPGNDNPFAMNSYIGLATLLLAAGGATESPALAIGALVFWVLSFGVGPWYWLPVLKSVRFPYRWHAGTLFCLAVMAGIFVDRLKLRWLEWLPVIEGLLLSPVEPLIPGASPDVPALYDQVQGPLLLEVPGPVALPPGEPNPSRARARYLLYYQTIHGAASPWTPDFNGVGGSGNAPWLSAFEACDPLVQKHREVVCGPVDLGPAKASGVSQVMVHREELGKNAAILEASLLQAGAVKQGEEGTLVLYKLP